MRILSHLNAEVGRGDIFKPATGNEREHEINDNGVTLVNSAT
jgi:hypothetical protein